VIHRHAAAACRHANVCFSPQGSADRYTHNYNSDTTLENTHNLPSWSLTPAVDLGFFRRILVGLIVQAELRMRLFLPRLTLCLERVFKTPAKSDSDLPTRALLRGVPLGLTAVLFFALNFWQWRLAEADYIRRHPESSTIQRAIALDPWHPYAYSLLAEFQQQQGIDSSSAWAAAAERAPTDAAIVLHLALASERNGDLNQAESLFLRAASLSKTWLPRWSLTNFYERHQNRRAALDWARASAQRAAGDLRPLFRWIESTEVSPADLALQYLPKNRNVLLAYLSYRVTQPDLSGIEAVAAQLLELIPGHPFGWPGLDFDLLSSWVARKFPVTAAEKAALTSVLERLLGAREGRRMVAFNNLLAAAIPDQFADWQASQLISNGQFAEPPGAGPLSWQLFRSANLSIDFDTRQKLAVLELSGRQAESLDLMTQTVFLPSRNSYVLEAETACDGCTQPTGFLWEFREFGTTQSKSPLIPIPSSSQSESYQWQRWTIPPAAQDRLWTLALRYCRPMGVARRGQVLRIRLVRIALKP
jgi:hypothetical protein